MKYPKLSLISMSVASLLLATTTSFAGTTNYKGENYKGEPPCPVEKGLLGGFYLGVQGGYDIYRTNVEVAAAAADGDTVTGEYRLSSPGWVGGGMVGYGLYLDQWYLGAEIFGNGSGAEGSANMAFTDHDGADSMTAEQEVEVTANYGIDFMPGYKINNHTLVYGRLGYNWARVKVEDDVTIHGVEVAGGDDDETSTVGGFHWGVGMESMVYENFSLRAEYTYTKFRHLDSDDDDSGSETEFTPADNQFMVGLLYHFA